MWAVGSSATVWLGSGDGAPAQVGRLAMPAWGLCCPPAARPGRVDGALDAHWKHATNELSAEPCGGIPGCPVCPGMSGTLSGALSGAVRNNCPVAVRNVSSTVPHTLRWGASSSTGAATVCVSAERGDQRTEDRGIGPRGFKNTHTPQLLPELPADCFCFYLFGTPSDTAVSACIFGTSLTLFPP